MRKEIYLLVILIAFGCFNVNAQNQSQNDSIAKADSIAKLNMQLQLTQDSLKKAQQVNTAQAASATKVKKDTRPIGQRFRGSFSTAFWANPSSIYFEISPMLTYYFPKTWSIGAGPTYIYNKDKDADKSLNGWGGKIYGRADVTKWLYGWTEYQGISSQQLDIESVFPYKTTKETEYVDSWFLSAGINLRFGRKYINLQALYDVLYKSDDSYLSSPWTYRVGFGF